MFSENAVKSCLGGCEKNRFAQRERVKKKTVITESQPIFGISITVMVLSISQN
jgi:hypothetical protein